MNNSVFRISLDIHRQTTQEHLAVKKGDTARQIIASLSDGGVPYMIDEGCYAVFMAKKPDGNVLFNDCTIENNQIVYDFTEQTASAVGRMLCELRLYGSDDALITSPRIAVIVSGAVYEDSEVESSSEFTALSNLVTEAKTVIEDAQQLEDGASAYEVAMDNGFEGTVEEWLESLRGPRGKEGDCGIYVGTKEPSNQNVAIWIDPNGEDLNEAEVARAVEKYLATNPPAAGKDGKSAYEIALEEGFDGSGAEWLESLQGAPGKDGADGKSAYQYAQDGGYTGTEEEFAEKLVAGIPSQLPNPHKLVITGAVSAEYDGSKAVAVEIPVGESSQQNKREWELFQSITMEEETSGWIIGSVDSLENAFSAKQYTEILLNFGAFVPPTSGGTATFSIQVNNNGGGRNGVIKNLLSTSGNSYFSVHIQRTGPAWSKVTAAEDGAYASKYGIVFCPTQDKELCKGSYIAYVRIITTMGKGTVITIYGR